MKTFYASLILFLLLVAVIICNTVYVQRVTGEIEKRLRDLPPCERAEEALRDLERYRKRHASGLELSIADDRLDRLKENIGEMQAAASIRDAAGFEQARARAICTVLQIRQTECPTLGDLLSLYIKQ